MTPDRTTQPGITPFGDFSIQAPVHTSLSNGIPLNLLEAGTEDVLRMDILIGAGIWHQAQPLQALFTHRMLREGCKGMTSAQISERLDFYGSWMELTTSMNYCYLSVYTLGRHFGHIMPLIGRLLREPTFPEKELKTTLETNRQQFLQNQVKVDVRARKEFNRAIYGAGHPSGRYAVKEDYDRLEVGHLSDFYHRHYHSGNCSVYLSGHVTPQAIALVESELGSAPWGEVKARLPLEEHPVHTAASGRISVSLPGSVQSAVKMGFKVIDQLHPDYIPVRVLATVLGGYFGSRLMKNIREEKGYTYGIMANVSAQPFTGVMSVTTETAHGHVEACISEIKREMHRLQDELMPAHELDMVKNYMLGDMCRSYEGALSLADAWIYTESAGLPEDFYTHTARCIRQSTPQQVQRMAQMYLRPDDSIEVVVGE